MPYSQTAREAKREAILQALREGTTRRAAVSIAGIHVDTFYAWMQASPTFSDAITRAEAEAQQFYEAQLKRAAPNDWRAASFWLERRRRREYGPELNLRALTNEQLAERIGGGADDELPTLDAEFRSAALPVPGAQVADPH